MKNFSLQDQGMYSTGDIVACLVCRYRVGLFRAKDLVYALVKYGFFMQFWKALLLLYVKYFFHSPFSVSKAFSLQQNYDDVYTYGQTPIKVMAALSKALDIHPWHRFVDLGCGSGRIVFMMASINACHATGVDHVPDFIFKGYDVCQKIRANNVQFIYGDIAIFPLEGYDIIYISGCCMPNSQLEPLANRLAKLPNHVRIITVSFALADFIPNAFTVHKVLDVKFEWGSAELFIQSPVV